MTDGPGGAEGLRGILERSRSLGFLGPSPIEDHLRHAVGFAQAVDDEPARVLDLGSGGGVPGLVLAVQTWTAARFTLVDARRRRSEFLADVVEHLGLSGRVTVVQARAEELGRRADHRGSYQVVLARSFGPPAVTAECGAPLLEVDGTLIVSEPPLSDSERWPAAGLAELCLVVEAQRSTGSAYARLRLAQPCPLRYPRRVGIPAKRPLFGLSTVRST